MQDEIFPDFEAITRVDRRCPWLSDEEVCNLAKKDVFIRLSGGVLSADGRTWHFPNGKRRVTNKMIRDFNRTRALSPLNCPRRYRHLAEEVLKEFGVTREQVQALFARVF
jgi:hypothetical protein